MKTFLKIYDLPLTCEMMQEINLPVLSVTTNDPRFAKDGREVRNVVVTWSVEPEDYQKKLAEWCVQNIGTVKHVVQQ